MLLEGDCNQEGMGSNRFGAYASQKWKIFGGIELEIGFLAKNAQLQLMQHTSILLAQKHEGPRPES
jgi:hypothetical protein